MLRIRTLCRMNAHDDYAKDLPDNAGVIAPPPLIYVVPLLASLLAHKAAPRAFLPRQMARAIGWALVAVASLTEVWFFRTMQRARTPMDPRRPVTTVVTSGPFRFSRNPSYVSFTLIYIGVSSLVNALWPILLLPGALFVVQKGVIEREERYLERKFGDEYTQYKARVRRWL